MRTHLIYARSERLEKIIMRGDELFSPSSTRVIKRTGRTLAAIVEVEGEGAIFLKRVRPRSWLAGSVGRLKASRARRAIAGAAMLKAAGFQCPALLAAAELRRAGSISATLVATEALLSAETFSRFAIAGPGGRRRAFAHRRRAFDAVAREVRRLHDAGLYTLDLQETNLMLAEGGAGGLQIYFIDLEDFRRARSAVSERRRLTNLLHLDRSIGRFASRSERLRFLHTYLGVRGRAARGEIHRLVAALAETRRRADGRSRARRGARIPLTLAAAPASAARGTQRG